MGVSKVKSSADKQLLNRFINALLTDLKALEKMIAAGMFEKDVQRIGAEQELCLVDASWRPSPIAMDVLKKADDKHLTTEISQFNLEFNLDPLKFSGDCLARLEHNLKDHLARLESVVKELGGEIILVGILPTIRSSDLELKFLTPLPRYRLLNRILNKMRGGPFELRIEDTDELITKHNSIMFEGCNTSFQVHLQVHPGTFVQSYNWAHAIAAPVPAAATNSPLLLGKRLWRETRIALFHQSVDTRSLSTDLRRLSTRVTFGDRWIKKSITEIFQEQIARYRVILVLDILEDSLEELDQGKIPSLTALCAHNGTLYRWNRPCYGILNGKPHLRIENRILPAGPTIVDEVANAAFWFGLMNGQPKEYRNIAALMRFDDAKTNFMRAARIGLDCQFSWVNGKVLPANELILKELLPIARDGLKMANIDTADIGKYLGIIKERVESRQTGARWMLESYTKLQKKAADYEVAVAIAAGIVKRQKKNLPVHRWSPVRISEAGSWKNRYWRVVQVMVTDLYTVQEDDPIALALNIMTWNNVRYLPVENQQKKLVGLLTTRILLKHYFSFAEMKDEPLTVKDIMIKNPKTIEPDTLTYEALLLMRDSGFGSLPVVKGSTLVGLITKQDYFGFSKDMIQDLLRK